MIITQVVYSADVFLEFLYNCRSLNIEIPIIPGLYMPRNFEDLKEMIRITKVQLPDGYYEEYRKHRNNDNAFHKFSVLSTLSVMREITKNCSEHIPGFHFYTMNNFSMIQTLLELKDYWSNHE